LLVVVTRFWIKERVMFNVGQKVWDVVQGVGIVLSIKEDATYPVHAEFANGGESTYTSDGKFREEDENPSLYPHPVEIVKKSVRQIVKPSINWEQVREEYRFLARDENNTAWLYLEEPAVCRVGWGVKRGVPAEAGSYVSYTPGTCDWKDSLVERPVV
jgi:hypothetical protein